MTLQSRDRCQHVTVFQLQVGNRRLLAVNRRLLRRDLCLLRVNGCLQGVYQIFQASQLPAHLRRARL